MSDGDVDRCIMQRRVRMYGNDFLSIEVIHDCIWAYFVSAALELLIPCLVFHTQTSGPIQLMAKCPQTACPPHSWSLTTNDHGVRVAQSSSTQTAASLKLVALHAAQKMIYPVFTCGSPQGGAFPCCSGFVVLRHSPVPEALPATLCCPFREQMCS